MLLTPRRCVHRGASRILKFSVKFPNFQLIENVSAVAWAYGMSVSFKSARHDLIFQNNILLAINNRFGRLKFTQDPVKSHWIRNDFISFLETNSTRFLCDNISAVERISHTQTHSPYQSKRNRLVETRKTKTKQNKAKKNFRDFFIGIVNLHFN